MTNRQRIESLDDLNAYLLNLFGPEIKPSEMNHYEVMFTVDGKVKKVMADLQEKTGKDGWRGESTFWCYSNDALNVSIGLSSAPGCVLVLASVASLHHEALKPYGA